MPLTGRRSSRSSAAAEVFRHQLPQNTPRKVHVIVLVHGIMGNPRELSYLQGAIDKQAAIIEATEKEDEVLHIVHVARANHGKTLDGIEAGGCRLSAEVNELLEQVVVGQEGRKKECFLSFVGYSLGGLYARFALSRISALLSSWVKPKIFCTIATPHLGTHRHTYIPLPRPMEYIVARVLGRTGLDLFHYTDMMEKLTTEPRFVEPLLAFERRIAYANAFATDFQVPTATAAFLSSKTDSVHNTVRVQKRGAFTQLVLETPQRATDIVAAQQEPDDKSLCSPDHLAERLDALGWEKVLVDLRPGLSSLPFIIPSSPSRSSSTPSPLLEHAQREATHTSKSLKRLFAGEHERGRRFFHPFPRAHGLLIASSKNRVTAKLNSGGRPLMEQLAADLLLK